MNVSRSTCLATLLIASSITLAAGCGDDEDETTPIAAPAGPPEVHIKAIHSSSGKSFVVDSDAPREVEAGCDPGHTVGVEIELKHFTRRPPGACGGTPQCGTVLVTVEGPGGKSSPVRSVALSVPIRLTDPPFQAGEHVFTVELRDSADQPITIPEAVASDSVTLDVRAPAVCGPKDGGADPNDADAADVSDTDAVEPDAASDAPPDVPPDTIDATTDQTVSDSPADVGEDQG